MPKFIRLATDKAHLRGPAGKDWVWGVACQSRAGVSDILSLPSKDVRYQGKRVKSRKWLGVYEGKRVKVAGVDSKHGPKGTGAYRIVKELVVQNRSGMTNSQVRAVLKRTGCL